MRFLLFSVFSFVHSTSSTDCPSQRSRQWLEDLTDVFTSLLDESSNTTVIPSSSCLPSFNPPECVPMRKKQICTSEVNYRSGFNGDFRLAKPEKLLRVQKCYVRVELRTAKPNVKVDKHSFINYCDVDELTQYSNHTEAVTLKNKYYQCDSGPAWSTGKWGYCSEEKTKNRYL